MLELIFRYISLQVIVWLVVALPLFSCVVNLILSVVAGNKKIKTHGQVAAVVSFVFSALTLAVSILITVVLVGFEDTSPAAITGSLFSWFESERITVDVGLKLDEISLSFMLLFVGLYFLINLYAVGHFSKKEFPQRSYALLNAGAFTILMAGLSDNLMVTLIGWIILGWITFFAITSNTDKKGDGPALKFSILDNVGNLLFLLAVAWLWIIALESIGDIGGNFFNYESLRLNISMLLFGGSTPILLLLIAVIIRMSQFPLFLHWNLGASSSVPIASVFTICGGAGLGIIVLSRLNFFYILFPEILNYMIIIGALSILFLALFAMVEMDILKAISMLAGSQMGLVLLSYGLGAPVNSYICVLTSLPFIVLFYLGGGNVVQATGWERSMDRISGLRYRMPTTFWIMMVSAISWAGIYPVGGFFSKSTILWEAYSRGKFFIWFLAFTGVAVMALSLFRIIGRIFFGELEMENEKKKYLQEAPVSQILAMLILSLIAVFGGWINASPTFGGEEFLSQWLMRPFISEIGHSPDESRSGSELILGVITVIWIAHAAIMSFIIYTQKRDWPGFISRRMGLIHRLLLNQFYWEKIANIIFVKPVSWVGKTLLSETIDKKIVYDLVVGGVPRSIKSLGRLSRIVETSRDLYFLSYFLIAILLVVVLFLI